MIWGGGRNAFTICHSDEYIKAKKRLYMTATPKVYGENAKNKAKEKDNFVFSMDDASIFGKDIYTLNFDQAIQQDLLVDYKVIILALRSENLAGVTNKAHSKISRLKAEGTKLNAKLIDNEFVCKIIGTHKGLAKQDLIALDSQNQEDPTLKDFFDHTPSTRAISFCRNIATSKNITHSFQTILDCYDEEMQKESFKNLKISIDHIDGTMNSKIRFQKISTLDDPASQTCNVLSNARCLSEGIDIPALDSIVFFDGRSAMVDIIQAVGRVMRKAEGKKIGYIILPIALSENEISNLDQAVENTNFQNIWKILKALRSHDTRLVDEAVFREKIKITLSDDTPQRSRENHQKSKEELKSLFDETTLKSLANAVYNVIPTKLGDRSYWESFSAKTAKIAETLNARLKDISKKKPYIFEAFLTALRKNIHAHIKEDEALEMLSSHIITKPIFDAVFGDNIQTNPISKALDKLLAQLKNQGLNDEETTYLNKLYENVRQNAQIAKSQKSKQELIKNLYDTFLQTVFKKQSERLGIVYTPIEVVDFILRSTNDLLKKHFDASFDDPSIKIYDPFTGTGSFIARLIANDCTLISDSALRDKFTNGLYAQEIILLSYYIALINITQSAQERDASLPLFANIALGDSLNYLEEENNAPSSLFSEKFDDLKTNKKIQNSIKTDGIRVILGNPPYSGGAKSQNDNNANLSHPRLEARVKETYWKQSKAQSAKNTRDNLIQAIRMASDRLSHQGILAFVTNGSFIDSTSADGFRKALSEEFSHLYIINLAGNLRKRDPKEGGNIFDKQIGVAILFLIKDPSKAEGKIDYHDIGDYLSKEDKLQKLRDFTSITSVPFQSITPNKQGDWINQRDTSFERLIPLKPEKKAIETKSIFYMSSAGIVSNRDAWVYNFDRSTLKQSIELCIDTYNKDLERFNHDAFKERTTGIPTSNRYKSLTDDDITTDPSKIAWTRSLKKNLIGNIKIADLNQSDIRIASYRPFTKEYLYWNKTWNEEQSQMLQIFPTPESKNLLINTTKAKFCALINNAIPDLHFIGDVTAYPLYYYDNGVRYSNITGYALSLFQEHYNDASITEKAIFYYIYAIFHHKGYQEKYKNFLSKESPRIGLSKDFHALSALGEKLASLHLNYENGEMHPHYTSSAQTPSDYEVTKMKKSKDGKSIIYNTHITITEIPPKAYEYIINSKSATDWIIERYQKKIDKSSLITNDPNLYAGGKYIFELLLRIITLSLKSIELIEEISTKDFE